jgi:hypothetical protein
VNDLKDEPFALIGVHVGGSTVAELQEFMERENLPWRSFVDLGPAGAGPIATSWNSPSIPTLLVLDAEGVIRHRWAGKVDPHVVDAALQKLIRETKDAQKRGK